MKEQIVSLAFDLLSILLPLLAIALVELIRRRLGTEKMRRIQKELEAKQELAALAVQFIEQVYRDYEGEEKFDAAADWLADRLTEKGIKISTAEITGLIEAALRAFKDEFGERWATAIEK